MRAGTVAGMRILVVEDEVDLADAIAVGLRREGYAVDVAHDVAKAVDVAAALVHQRPIRKGVA